MNDYDDDVLDVSNSKPISRVSEILKYNAQGQRVMYNVAEFIPQQSVRYSHWWDRDNDCEVAAGELTLIDHLFITPQLRDQITSVRIYNSIECDSLKSDHFPIKVVFEPFSNITIQ